MKHGSDWVRQRKGYKLVVLIQSKAVVAFEPSVLQESPKRQRGVRGGCYGRRMRLA